MIATIPGTQTTLGLDVSDSYSSYCLLDENGEILEEGRLKTSEAAFRRRFDGESCRVVVEAGVHSPWISRLFSSMRYNVIVANPRKVQLIAQSTKKNDRADASPRGGGGLATG